MLTPEQLADLRAKAEAATPGPWHSNYDPQDNMLEGKNCEWVMGLSPRLDGCPFLKEEWDGEELDAFNNLFPCKRGVDIPEADLEYIAAVNPATVLQLLDMLGRLEKEADWLAQAAANGGMDGWRVSAELWREKARKAVEGVNCEP